MSKETCNECTFKAPTPLRTGWFICMAPAPACWEYAQYCCEDVDGIYRGAPYFIREDAPFDCCKTFKAHKKTESTEDQ